MNDNKRIIKARKILNAVHIVAATIFWIALGVSAALWVLQSQLPADQLIAVAVVLIGIGMAFFRVLSIAYDPILFLLEDSTTVADKVDNLEAVVTGKPRPRRDDEKFITAKPVRNELEEATAKPEKKGFFASLFGEKNETAAKTEPSVKKEAPKEKKTVAKKEEKKPAEKSTKTVKADKTAEKPAEKKPAKKTAAKTEKPAAEKKAAPKKAAAEKKPAKTSKK